MREGYRFLERMQASVRRRRAIGPPSRRTSSSIRKAERDGKVLGDPTQLSLAEASRAIAAGAPVAGGADRGLSRPHRRARRRAALAICWSCPTPRWPPRASAEAELKAGRSRGRAARHPDRAQGHLQDQGIRTTAGSRVYETHVPNEDAETWVRLRNAGAVLLGKQETHEFAIGGPDFTLPFPPARNPWNTAHYPAGSSSGSAAAVGAHLCAAAMGSDTGGSIRGPAAYCGIAGLKPTYGRVSRRGVFPLVLHARPLRAADPHGRGLRADDAGAGRATTRSTRPRPTCRCPITPPALTPRLDGLRIGVIRHLHEKDAVAGFGRDSAPSPTYVARLRRRLPHAGEPRRRLVDLQLSPLIDYRRRQPHHHARRGLCAARAGFPRAAAAVRPAHVRADRARRIPLSAADYVEAVRQRRELCAEIRRGVRRRRRRRLGQRHRAGAADRRGRHLQHLRAAPPTPRPTT